MKSSRPMWKHQEETVIRAFQPNTDDLAIFAEQGTGKTRTLLEILRRLYASNGRVLNTLIICPLNVKRQWKEQFEEYTKINKFDVVVLEGSEKRRIKQFADSVTVDGQLKRNRIIIVNPHTLEMEELMKTIEQWGVETLIVDESHEFKSHKSKRAKRLVPIADKCKHVYISTGTPIANSEADIFMQFRILDGGRTFGTNYYVFHKKYFRDANQAWAHRHNHFPKYECPPEARDEISRLMYTKAVRHLKKDCLDLPPLVKQSLYVEMSAEQKKAYEQMREEFITFIKDNQDKPRTVVAQLAITKAMKLQQIVTGFAFDEVGNAVRFKSVPRLESLRDLLERLTKESKVVVWANFKENYKMISEVLTASGIKHTFFIGNMTPTEREENKQAFLNDPEVRVAIANQGAAGTGLDGLQKVASYMVYYSKDASLLKDSQSEARIDRSGSEVHEKITRIDFICEDTIDEAINDALANKKDLADYILDKEMI